MRHFFGGEVCLANLAAGLVRGGHEVTGIVRPGSRLARELPARGVPARELPLHDWYDPVTVRAVRAWLRDGDIDVIHAHTPRDWFIAAAASVGTGSVVVASRHVLRPVAHAALKRPFLRRLGALIAVSGAVGDAARGLLAPERSFVVPNGVAVPAPAVEGDDPRAELGLAPGDAVVGCVARLRPEKGVAVVLEAAARLRERWPRLVVVVLGDDPSGTGHPDELRRLAARLGLGTRVRFCGYRADAARLCGAFDVHVTASLAEPCGLATLEAMARGRPVVGTASGGTPELIDDGIEGFLVPPADPARLAARLDCLLDSPGLRSEMGRRGLRRVQRDFSLGLMVDRTEAVYRLALARAAG